MDLYRRRRPGPWDFSKMLTSGPGAVFRRIERLHDFWSLSSRNSMQFIQYIRKVAHNAVQWPYTDSRWECKAMHDNIHDESLLMVLICYMQTWFCELRTCAHRSGDPGWWLSDSQAKDMPCTSIHLMGIGLLSSLWQVSADSPLEETFELFHATLLIVGTVLMMKFNFR